jgi:hypothetical protein
MLLGLSVILDVNFTQCVEGEVMSSDTSKTLIHAYVKRVWNRGEPACRG